LFVVPLDSDIKDLLIEALSKRYIGIKQVCSSLIKCATVSYNRQTLNFLKTDQSLTRVYIFLTIDLVLFIVWLCKFSIFK